MFLLFSDYLLLITFVFIENDLFFEHFDDVEIDKLLDGHELAGEALDDLLSDESAHKGGQGRELVLLQLFEGRGEGVLCLLLAVDVVKELLMVQFQEIVDLEINVELGV